MNTKELTIRGETPPKEKPMAFDYFRRENAEQYSFYRIPKVLITSDHFSGVSTDAKLLYGLMLDRLSLSIRNGWVDEDDHVYIIYTVEEIMSDLRCSNKTAVKLLSELEKSVGLIRRKRQGLGKPSLTYVLNFSVDSDDSPNGTTPDCNSSKCDICGSEADNLKKCKNYTSGSEDSTFLEVKYIHTNKTNNNKTNFNNPIYPSTFDMQNTEPEKTMDEKESNPVLVRNHCKNYFLKKLDYESLLQKNPFDHGRIDEIISLLVEITCSRATNIRVAGENKPTAIVKSRLRNLKQEHVQYVLDSFHDNSTDIRNIKSYMLTMLYNAPLTIDHYYQSKFNHIQRGKVFQAAHPEVLPSYYHTQEHSDELRKDCNQHVDRAALLAEMRAACKS